MPTEPDWIAVAGWQPRQVSLAFLYRSGRHALAVFETLSDPSPLQLAVFSDDPVAGWQLAAEGVDVDVQGYFGWASSCVFGWGRGRRGQEVRVDYRGTVHTVQADADGWWAFVHDVDPAAGDLAVAKLA